MLLFSPDPKSQAEGVASLLDFQGSSGGAGHTGERGGNPGAWLYLLELGSLERCPLELCNDGTSEICILAPLVLSVVGRHPGGCVCQ